MRASLSLGCDVNTKVYAVDVDAQDDRHYPRGPGFPHRAKAQDRQDLQSLAASRGPYSSEARGSALTIL